MISSFFLYPSASEGIATPGSQNGPRQVCAPCREAIDQVINGVVVSKQSAIEGSFRFKRSQLVQTQRTQMIERQYIRLGLRIQSCNTYGTYLVIYQLYCIQRNSCFLEYLKGVMGGVEFGYVTTQL